MNNVQSKRLAVELLKFVQPSLPAGQRAEFIAFIQLCEQTLMRLQGKRIVVFQGNNAIEPMLRLDAYRTLRAAIFRQNAPEINATFKSLLERLGARVQIA